MTFDKSGNIFETIIKNIGFHTKPDYIPYMATFYKDGSRNYATFKFELFATIGNGRAICTLLRQLDHL